ncbi:LpqB family beta-propeller domain-containing protein [Modestobacter altitudinis]|uniref:LpqB family beta-propeller domain-containing protein n=1 Tax=Modestobacter altitudinis TaxID=2213158 RepID=UPI00110CBA82|nr:LpqB family beta-propeller domain-containing protein [Modestobacter altitudinis]
MSRSPRRAPAVAVLALALVALLAGCTTVPTESATVKITQVAQPSDDAVRLEPLAPEAGAAPEEVVRGFIDASASAVRRHPVARQYLAGDAALNWSDSDGVTVISQDYAPVQSQPGTVVVTGTLVGTVDERGVFIVGTGSVYTRTFTLSDDSGEWRITDPPDGLLLLEPDFARTYEQVDAYFLDPTGTRVVPDPRYLVSGEAQPNTLVTRLLEGASPLLAAGVVNPLAGAQLRSTVSVTETMATVDLSFPAEVSDATLAAASAQLTWSLSQVGLNTVRVLRDGQDLDLPDVPEAQSTADWVALDPDVAPIGAVGHYLTGGGLRLASDGSAPPGPAGAGGYGLVSAAVTVDARTNQLGFMAGVSAVVSPAGDPATLLAGTYGGDLTPVLSGAGFTDPTVAGTRSEVWTVRNGTDVVRLPSGGSAQSVSATTMAGLGRATAFQLSPDGVRAAVVIQGAQGGQVYVGTVVRDDDAVSVRDLRSVAPTVEQVVDVAWRNAGLLMVLAGDPSTERTVPYTVGVDGWELSTNTTSGLPGQPTAVAAAPGRQPLVSANGTMWTLAGGNWVTLVRGQEPLPGTAPFYPM